MEGAVKDWMTGSIKWYDPSRRYGFIVPDRGEGEIFLCWRELRKARIPETGVQDGARVHYTARPADKPGKCRHQVDQIKLAG